jgi:hypothetical protein
MKTEASTTFVCVLKIDVPHVRIRSPYYVSDAQTIGFEAG